MSPKEFFKVFQQLSDATRTRITKNLPTAQERDNVRRIFVTLSRMDRWENEEIEQKTGFSKWKLARMIKALQPYVLQELGASDPTCELQARIVAARRLMDNMLSASATALLKLAWNQAVAEERFPAMMEIAQLNAQLPRPIPMAPWSVEDILTQQGAIVALQQGEFRLRQIQDPSCTAADRQQILEEVSQILAELPAKADLHKRAQALYLKVKSGISLYSGRYSETIGTQQQLVEVLAACPWIDGDDGWRLTREYGLLVFLMVQENRLAAAQKVLFRAATVPESSDRIRLEKLVHLYPSRLIIALRNGDTEQAGIALETLIFRTEEMKGLARPGMIIRNLYLAAYYCVAAQDWVRAQILLRKLQGYARADFPQLIWPMARVLEMVVYLETGDPEDVIRAVRNFRKTKHYGTTPWFKSFLGLLFRMANQPQRNHPGLLRKYISRNPVTAETRLCNDYFDAFTWAESKLNGCPMTQVFGQQASQNTSSSATA